MAELGLSLATNTSMKNLIFTLIMTLSLLTVHTALARPTMADSSKIPDVSMDEVMFSRPDVHPLIQSYGATTCIILSLWDPKTKIGMVTHISANANTPESLTEIFAKFRHLGIQPQQLQARIVGGWKGWSEEILQDILRGLKRNSITIVERDVLRVAQSKDPLALIEKITGPVVANVIFDLRDGQLYDYQETISFSENSPAPTVGPGEFLRLHPLSL